MPFDMGREWMNATNRMLYVTQRHQIIGNVLRKARAGELEPAWRNDLRVSRHLEPGGISSGRRSIGPERA